MKIEQAAHQARSNRTTTTALFGLLSLVACGWTYTAHAMQRAHSMSLDAAVESLRRCDTRQKQAAATETVLAGILRTIDVLKSHGGDFAAPSLQQIHEATR
jgi:hypothetical protein